eukprot:9118942-Ditylum_brightwellii.AAC.1
MTHLRITKVLNPCMWTGDISSCPPPTPDPCSPSPLYTKLTTMLQTPSMDNIVWALETGMMSSLFGLSPSLLGYRSHPPPAPNPTLPSLV